ncbi:MAG TPA: hypothetical protein VH143_09250 [Kofleriaceae bacterium]|jgi:hypothetical protein|nr:hypothetical protein [Kofleriaceae bacterium]
MTRAPYSSCVDPRELEVRRLLDRYIEEIVEAYDLCPWARAARTGGELAVATLWGTPSSEPFAAAANELLSRPETRVAMVVAPELAVTPTELRELRGEVAKLVTIAGVAEFHPDAPLDATTPARLVPYLRRSPDPMLQLVPHAILASVRTPQPRYATLDQLKALNDLAAAPKQDIGDRIAATNHARVAADGAAIEAKLVEIFADRDASYARVGISRSR